MREHENELLSRLGRNTGVKAHGTTTNQVSADKERNEVQFDCDGSRLTTGGFRNRRVELTRQ